MYTITVDFEDGREAEEMRAAMKRLKRAGLSLRVILPLILKKAVDDFEETNFSVSELVDRR